MFTTSAEPCSFAIEIVVYVTIAVTMARYAARVLRTRPSVPTGSSPSGSLVRTKTNSCVVGPMFETLRVTAPARAVGLEGRTLKSLMVTSRTGPDAPGSAGLHAAGTSARPANRHAVLAIVFQRTRALRPLIRS